MFSPLPEGVYSMFNTDKLDQVLESMERRPVAAGYLVDGDVIEFESSEARYSWLV
ncbi:MULTISPECIES: hypothetical protein [unclassified Corynebacterium]|uniref:hypothetical protein n=1 Tax=unclassified Corynebacterium TaxID=2624378 RepID=UPI00309A4359